MVSKVKFIYDNPIALGNKTLQQEINDFIKDKHLAEPGAIQYIPAVHLGNEGSNYAGVMIHYYEDTT